MLALMDFDPDGVGIMSTYKYGSVSLAHENKHLNVPKLRWIGVMTSDLCHVGWDGSDSLLPMSLRDRRRAMRLLEKEIFAEHGPETTWRREIQVMLMLSVKAEIQIMEKAAGGLPAWLDDKIRRACQGGG